MATTTPNLGLTKPTVGADADAWGGQLNASLDTLDVKVLDKTTGGTVSGAVNVIAATTAPAVRITQTGTGEALRVEDEANPDASPFVIDAAGNVGVGTGTPAFKMDVAVSGVTSDVAIRSVADSVSNVASLRFFCQNTTEGARISAIRTAATAAPNDLAFYTAVGGVAQEKMRIDSAGNLGLGVAPSVWSNQYKAFETSSGSLSGQSGAVLRLMQNAYVNAASNFTYVSTAAASQYVQAGGAHSWHTVGSGTAATQFSFTQAMTLDSAGNLGLGVTPSAWNAAFKAIEFNNGSFSSTVNGPYVAYNAFFGATNWQYKTTAASSYYLQNNGQHQFYTAPSGTAGAPITFTQAMTLTSGGNLLVGTATDNGGRLRVVNTGIIADFTNNVDANFAIIEASGTIKVGPSVGANLAFQTAGTERARITSAGYFKASNTGVYGGVGGIPDATNTLYHLVQNNQNTTTFAAFNGNTLSNVLNYDSVLASGATGRHYSGLLNAATVYEVIANGNVRNVNNSYGAFSDIKLKENVTDATPKLASLNQLRVVNYNLIGSELKQIGLIAQEVEQVFPGLVESTPDLDPETKEPTGTVTKSVKYSVLVPMLLKAVQELSAKVAALEAK